MLNDIKTVLGCDEATAEKVYALVCVGGLSFSNSSREQLNSAYRNAFRTLKMLGKV